MRSLDEIFNEHSFKAIGSISPSKPFCLAAMKEAREDAVKAVFLWLHQEGHVDFENETEINDDWDEEILIKSELMDLYNTHLAAIEAEKERGKNG